MAAAPQLRPGEPQAATEVEKKTCMPPDPVQDSSDEEGDKDDGPKLPHWANTEVILATIARDISRLAAPGPDGWTRELWLASICRQSAPTWETIVNSVLRGKPPAAVATLLRAAHLALWQKESGNGARIIGMTSVVAKCAWKIAVMWHLKCHAPPKNAAAASGGALKVIRRAEAHLRGAPIMVADVVDAFWRVNRKRVLKQLEKTHSPMAYIFKYVYGSCNPLYHGDKCYSQRAGVLPGCGGAAMSFMIDLDMQLQSVDRADVELYMDDVTCFSRTAFEGVVNALGADNLAKARIIDPTAMPGRTRVAGLEVEISPAGKHLGAFLGETGGAVALANARVDNAARVLDDIQLSPLSCQAKWKLLRSVLLSLQWLPMATRPEVADAVAARIDDRIYAFIMHLLPHDATPTHNSSLLAHLPMAAGGCGIMAFAMDGAALYEVTTASVNETDLSSRKLRQRLDERIIERTTQAATIPHVFFEARRDDSSPWFEVAALSARTKISDEAWRLGMAHFLAADMPTPTCPAHDAAKHKSWDHSQQCHTCAAPFRGQRHQRVVQEFIAVASKYGVIATLNFEGIYGIAQGGRLQAKRPDIIVHRPSMTESVRTLCLDVVVPHQGEGHAYNTLTRMHSYKVKKYEDFDAENTEVLPFVVSTVATIDYRSLAMLTDLQKYAARNGFVRELVARVKTAVITFEAYRVKALMTKRTISGWQTIVQNESGTDAD
jgi:hypothetical protein